jgi:hypothetical protein
MVGSATAFLVVLGMAALGGDTAKKRTPRVCKVEPESVTVVMGSDAALSGALKELYPGEDWKRFWVENWRQTSDRFEWTLESPKADDYEVALVLKDESRAGAPCEIELAAGDSKLTYAVRRERFWNRHVLPGTLHLGSGRSAVTLQASKLPAGGKLALLSMELVRPAVKRSMQERAEALRSSTAWMVQAKYGVMTHWTARSKPRHGAAKPYAEAVRDFNVESFAGMVQRTGAGFAVLTTSWADYYFPAPIKAIEEILPGRTSGRDLVADLSDALGRRGLKLMLYYHPGHDDTPWWSKQKYEGQESKAGYFDLWCRVIASIGQRYGSKLAGWWFDDGMVCYYPYSPPWEEMTRAAKAGNPARVVAYNSWILPKPTDFQDYFCGESDFAEYIGKEFLPKGGSGRFIGGPQAGLQAALTWMLESGNWCHLEPDKEILPPVYTQERLARFMRGCVARRIVPMLNLETYQDGTAATASVDLLRTVGESLRSTKGPAEQVEDDVANGLLAQKDDIALESADGKIGGGSLVYVENVDCITHWVEPLGNVRWAFTAPKSGKYTVVVTCVHGNGPSEYEVSVGEQKFTGKIAGTGADPGWSDYRDEVLGAVELAQGQRYEATIHATSMPKGAPMNLRRILLRPPHK